MAKTTQPPTNGQTRHLFSGTNSFLQITITHSIYHNTEWTPPPLSIAPARNAINEIFPTNSHHKTTTTTNPPPPTPDGPAIVRINLFVRSIMTISDIKMVSFRLSSAIIWASQPNRSPPISNDKSPSLSLTLPLTLHTIRPTTPHPII